MPLWLRLLEISWLINSYMNSRNVRYDLHRLLTYILIFWQVLNWKAIRAAISLTRRIYSFTLFPNHLTTTGTIYGDQWRFERWDSDAVVKYSFDISYVKIKRICCMFWTFWLSVLWALGPLNWYPAAISGVPLCLLKFEWMVNYFPIC